MVVISAVCVGCGGDFPQRTGPGRRRDYCTPACRRRAQRRRQAASSALPPGVAPVRQAARELLGSTLAVVDAHTSNVSLGELLALVDHLKEGVDRFVVSAVHQVRLTAGGWDGVAREAGVSAGAARSRWGAGRAGGRWAIAFPAARSRPAGSDERLRARRLLADALAFLERVSGRAPQDVAQQTGLDSTLVEESLAGLRLPGWPEVGLIVSAMGGRPSQLRVLWRWAAGEPLGDAGTPGTSLHDALAGLYLSAGCPPAGEVSAWLNGRLAARRITAVLRGAVTPDWASTELLLAALGADPEPWRPLWQEARCRAIASGTTGTSTEEGTW